ncbi:MAG: hypothetical protein AAGA56_20930 [Myxococcota bacterium]
MCFIGGMGVAGCGDTVTGEGTRSSPSSPADPSSPSLRCPEWLDAEVHTEFIAWAPESVANEGQVETDAVVDGVLSVRIRGATGCLSFSCDTQREGTCTVMRIGDRIEVESRFSWASAVRADREPRTTSGIFCTADCGSIEVECGLTDIPAGAYPIVHGADEAQVRVEDGAAPAVCFGQPFNGFGCR